MDFASLGGLFAAGLGLLAVTPASTAAASRPPVPLVGPHHGLKPMVTGCTSDSAPGNYFVGIANPNADDFAGFFSGVLDGDRNEACDAYDGIGGGYENTIGSTDDLGAASESFIGSGTGGTISARNAFIGAGSGGLVVANGSFVGAGTYNAVTANNAFVGAGENNLASAEFAFVGGGDHDSADGEGAFVGAGERNGAARQSFVGSGYYNDAAGSDSFVGGGVFNFAYGNGSFIGGGNYTYYSSCKSSGCMVFGNTITGVDSFIGAGDQNSVSANEAFVGSGTHNTIAGSAEFGTIAGGHFNAVSGLYATIPGGANNTAAGELSLAAGFHAGATHAGSFVWSDFVSGSSVVKDSAANQFVVRASGGTYVYSSENLTSGVELAAGSGTWASLSDRDAKTDIGSLDDAAILAKVAALPVSTWRYKTESGVRHVGPMAQDFYAAFGVGEDDRHISSIDEDGVALAAIKALRADDLKVHAENATLRDRLAALEKKVDALAAK